MTSATIVIPHQISMCLTVFSASGSERRSSWMTDCCLIAMGNYSAMEPAQGPWYWSCRMYFTLYVLPSPWLKSYCGSLLHFYALKLLMSAIVGCIDYYICLHIVSGILAKDRGRLRSVGCFDCVLVVMRYVVVPLIDAPDVLCHAYLDMPLVIGVDAIIAWHLIYASCWVCLVISLIPCWLLEWARGVTPLRAPMHLRPHRALRRDKDS